MRILPVAVSLAVSLSLALVPRAAQAEQLLKSTRYPLWVHYADDGSATSAQATLATLEDAWHFQVESLGFPPPPSDAGENGSDDYDLFLQTGAPMGEGGCETGAPVPAHPGGNASRIVLDPSIPLAALPLVVSHEFHHAIQIGICGNIGNNVAESDAVYISALQRPGEEKELTYSLGINTFQQYPQRSLDWTAELGNPYPYGSALFLMFLDQKHGAGDGRLMQRMWELMQQARDATGTCPHYFDALRQIVDFDASFREFARARWFVGKADDGAHIRGLKAWEGGALPQKELVGVTLATDHKTLPVADTKPAAEASPMPYGITYVRFSLAGLGGDDRVRLSFRGDPKMRWSVQTILTGGAGAAPEASNDVDASGSRDLDLTVGGHTALVVGFANLGYGKYVGDGPGWNASTLHYALAKLEPDATPPADAPPAPPPSSTDGGCALAARPSLSSSSLRGALALAVVASALARRRRHR